MPLVLSGYRLSFMINLLSFTVLTAAWSLFSGTTRYISLATAALSRHASCPPWRECSGDTTRNSSPP